jgi:purine catabolism regulator
VQFERLAGRGFSSLVDAGAAVAWAAEYVSGISASPESVELMATIRAWLNHHGQVDAAASELGVHRHTVRHRLRRAETLLERSLDDPSVRADLWFALRSVDEQAIQLG